MKRLTAALMIVAFAAVPALAELPSIKQGVKDKMPAMTTPQQKIKQIPKTAVVPQTGQEGVTQPETQETAPQSAPNMQFVGIDFMPDSQTGSACTTKWVATIQNSGTAGTGSIVLRPTFRKAEGIDELVWHDIPMEPVPAGMTSTVPGYVPPREHGETEVKLELRDGNTVLATAVFPLPVAVAPSADNLALSEPVISGAWISFEVQNTSNADVNAVLYVVQGIVDPASPIREQLAVGSVACLPAGGTENVRANIPFNPYPVYRVVLFTGSVTNVLVSKTLALP